MSNAWDDQNVSKDISIWSKDYSVETAPPKEKEDGMKFKSSSGSVMKMNVSNFKQNMSFSSKKRSYEGMISLIYN